MKLKMSRNDLKGATCICCGYGELQRLLSWFSPIGYNAGIYGWNWDCYHIGRFYIITGYRSFPACKGYIYYDDAQKADKKTVKTRAAAEKILIKLCENALKK